MKRLSVLLAFMVCFSAFGGTYEISLENDAIGGTDQHYTHGTRITYLYPIESSLFADKNAYRSWSIGQYMYTPSEIDVETIQVGDRPYAGWLYGSTSVSVDDGEVLDMLGITLGVAGEWSLAGDTQKMIHRWLDSTEPQGWDTQVDERIGFDLTYGRRHKWKADYADIILKADVSLGNIYCLGGLGVVARFGYNIPDDFGMVRMEPIARSISDFGIYGILEASERLVVYNYFLEGDDIESTYDINMSRSVYEMAVGCGAYYKGFNAIYLYNIRSREFKEQEEHSKFGTVAISWSY